MRSPRPLHPRFRDRPFVTTEAIRAGVTPARLRGSDLTAPFRGVRTARRNVVDLEDRCLAYVRIMPSGSAFSHGTAALLLGIPVPVRIKRERLIHVAVRPPRRAPRVDGVSGHQLDLRTSDVLLCRGVPVTSPARTWCDLAFSLSLPELVAVGDFLIARRRRLNSREELLAAVERRGRGRGVAKLRMALRLLSDRSESFPESILRMLFVDAGLPPVDVNVDLRDASGRFVARPDLRFPDFRLVVEYDGDGHRADRAQWRRDFGRIARLQVLGEEVLRVGADDLEDETELLRVVRVLLARQGWRGP